MFLIIIFSLDLYALKPICIFLCHFSIFLEGLTLFNKVNSVNLDYKLILSKCQSPRLSIFCHHSLPVSNFNGPPYLLIQWHICILNSHGPVPAILVHRMGILSHPLKNGLIQHTFKINSAPSVIPDV